MKVQLKDIVLAVPALSKLSAGDLQLRLAYKLKRMISALQKEADFFAEQRQMLGVQQLADLRRVAAPLELELQQKVALILADGVLIQNQKV